MRTYIMFKYKFLSNAVVWEAFFTDYAGTSTGARANRDEVSKYH